MAKVAVVFKSKYGSSEKYARWIAEDVNADVLKASDVKVENLMEYDTIVYCGGLYAGGLLGFSLIKKNYRKLSHKRIIVAAVGATTKKEEAVREVKEKNFTPEMQDKVQLFVLRGGLDYQRMNVMDRFLMFLLVKSLKSKKSDELDDDSKALIATYGKVVDFTNRDTIAPIVEMLKG
ncbi:MAG: flavodoxin domain-containing protein [Acetivibrionales bacterium]|jgi:menaquinone-dependent protoporphyrinogen IX oxidase